MCTKTLLLLVVLVAYFFIETFVFLSQVWEKHHPLLKASKDTREELVCQKVRRRKRSSFCNFYLFPLHKLVQELELNQLAGGLFLFRDVKFTVARTYHVAWSPVIAVCLTRPSMSLPCCAGTRQFLKKFLHYSKHRVHPELTESARGHIASSYASLRSKQVRNVVVSLRQRTIEPPHCLCGNRTVLFSPLSRHVDGGDAFAVRSTCHRQHSSSLWCWTRRSPHYDVRHPSR